MGQTAGSNTAVALDRLAVSFSWQSAGEISLDERQKLQFPVIGAVPGLYRIRFVQSRSVYVGEAINLKRRMQNYRTPGSRQATSIWVSAQLIDRIAAKELIVLEVCDRAIVDRAGDVLDVDLTSKTVRLFAECGAILAEQQNNWIVLNKAD